MSPTNPVVIVLCAIALVVIGRKFRFTWLVVTGWIIIVLTLAIYSPTILPATRDLFGQFISACWGLISSIDWSFG